MYKYVCVPMYASLQVYLYVSLSVYLFGLTWFYGISIIVGYLKLNPFYIYKQFYFKLFSLV